MKKHWKITIKYDTAIFHSKLSSKVCLICGDLNKSSPFGCWHLSLPVETISTWWDNIGSVQWGKEHQDDCTSLEKWRKNPENCLYVFLNLVSANFYQILFLHQMIALKKLWKMFFISSKKLFLLSRYLNFCVFSLPFHTFQIQKVKWKWNNLCHELTWINLQM